MHDPPLRSYTITFTMLFVQLLVHGNMEQILTQTTTFLHLFYVRKCHASIDLFRGEPKAHRDRTT